VDVAAQAGGADPQADAAAVDGERLDVERDPVEPRGGIRRQRLQVAVMIDSEVAQPFRLDLDQRVGLRPDVSNLPEDGFDWPAYVARVEEAARLAAGRAGRTVES